MPMTLVNAKTYVSRVLGGGSSQETIDAAAEAIERGYSDWQMQKYWRFLLKNTSRTTSVSAPAAANGATLSANGTMIAANALNFVNIGQTVTYSGTNGSLAAGTTVSSYTRNTDGTIASIVLSNAVTGIGTTEAGTFTFSADIPIKDGTNEYNLPLDYNVAATAKFISTDKHRVLIYRDQAYWDRVQPDETLRGLAAEFTTFNPVSDATQNYGETRLKFDRIPDSDDTLRLLYFRKFNTTGTYIDIPDEYLYKFLDYCRSLLLEAKRAKDDPSGYRDSVIDAMTQAVSNDEEGSTESDVHDCIKSQYEMGLSGVPLWQNGDFNQYYGV